MKTTPAWDDLALFAAVARAGALAPAAAETGTSPATLSRRMKALEARLGRRLFLHGSSGYTITADGRELLERTARMEAAATDIAQWQAAAAGPVCVRISAGTWTALHLADGLPRYWSPDASWLPEFVHCERPLDIARREIDIGLRNARPDHPWLAGRRVGTTEFAVFGAGHHVEGWIGASEDAARTRSWRWVEDRHGGKIVTRTNFPKLACAMAIAGVGRVVLPTFIGGHFKELTQLSDTIPELTSEQWLVSHHEGRHERPVRDALDAIAGFLTRQSTRFVA